MDSKIKKFEVKKDALDKRLRLKEITIEHHKERMQQLKDELDEDLATVTISQNFKA